MRNVVFLHKRTLYFAVASRKGCVDFSMIQFARCIKRIRSHPVRDAWILAANYSSGVPQIEVASRKGCVDLSVIHFFAFFQYLSHPARDAWILAVYRDYNKYNDLVASYMGCVASSMVAQIYFC